MEQNTTFGITNIAPETVWSELAENPNAALVDVRTAHEWSEIGTPDLSDIDRAMYHVEWRQLPGMVLNDAFVEQLDEQIGTAYPEKLFFICRSGSRSHEAATLMQDVLSKRSVSCVCINVAEGFEGEQSPQAIAAGTSGWRNKGLAWDQKT